MIMITKAIENILKKQQVENALAFEEIKELICYEFALSHLVYRHPAESWDMRLIDTIHNLTSNRFGFTFDETKKGIELAYSFIVASKLGPKIPHFRQQFDFDKWLDTVFLIGLEK